MSPETLDQNYTSGGGVLSSTETLPMDDLIQILDSGLEYTSNLMSSKGVVVPELSMPVDKSRSYVTEVALGRLNRLYQEASKGEIKVADSITIFNGLREKVCKEMPALGENLSNDKLSHLLKKCFDLFFSDEPDPRLTDVDLKKVRNFVAQLIPGNPQVGVVSAHNHILD